MLQNQFMSRAFCQLPAPQRAFCSFIAPFLSSMLLAVSSALFRPVAISIWRTKSKREEQEEGENIKLLPFLLNIVKPDEYSTELYS